MMVVSEPQDEINEWEILKNDVKDNYEQALRELKEIELMMEHSQLEVSKLTQRNASITAHLQQVQGQFDSLPRGDIRQAYDNALDGQQRLFVMRGQLEKLQSDHAHLERYTTTLAQVLELMDHSEPGKKRIGAPKATVETVEMMIQAQEAERQRLSRQMHDGPAQALSNFILQTEIAMRLFDIDQAKAREELESLKGSATSTFQKVRDFIFELRPMMLDDLGLAPTLKRYIDAVKDQSGADIQLMVTGMERRLENYLEVMVFRAVQELLGSAIRENHATKVTVDLDVGEKNVKVTVDDNGKGFDLENLSDRNNMGIKVIKERVEMLGGFMDISSVINQGTRITFQIPAMTSVGFA
jgi:two-component system, NarL family, sensor histidine kinase DegS